MVEFDASFNMVEHIEPDVDGQSLSLDKHIGDSLAQHDSISLDTANTLAGNTKFIDHDNVRVSTDDGVRVEYVVAVEDFVRDKPID